MRWVVDMLVPDVNGLTDQPEDWVQLGRTVFDDRASADLYVALMLRTQPMLVLRVRSL